MWYVPVAYLLCHDTHSDAPARCPHEDCLLSTEPFEHEEALRAHMVLHHAACTQRGRAVSLDSEEERRVAAMSSLVCSRLSLIGGAAGTGTAHRRRGFPARCGADWGRDQSGSGHL